MGFDETLRTTRSRFSLNENDPTAVGEGIDFTSLSCDTSRSPCDLFFYILNCLTWASNRNLMWANLCLDSAFWSADVAEFLYTA